MDDPSLPWLGLVQNDQQVGDGCRGQLPRNVNVRSFCSSIRVKFCILIKALLGNHLSVKSF